MKLTESPGFQQFVDTQVVSKIEIIWQPLYDTCDNHRLMTLNQQSNFFELSMGAACGIDDARKTPADTNLHNHIHETNAFWVGSIASEYNWIDSPDNQGSLSFSIGPKEYFTCPLSATKSYRPANEHEGAKLSIGLAITNLRAFGVRVAFNNPAFLDRGHNFLRVYLLGYMFRPPQ